MKSSRTNRAFTLVELFVVIAVTLIAVAAALPAFTAMTRSSRRSLAENTLKVAVTFARDTAIQSGRSGDGAAVFLYDPEAGRIRVVPAEYVGTITDLVDGITSRKIERDVFVPVLTSQTIELPDYWMVRGWAPARFVGVQNRPAGLGFDWYDSSLYSDRGAWDRGHWVFPEDGFYDRRADPGTPVGRGVSPRQSFMIRFDAETGQLRRDGRESLLLDPRPSSKNRANNLARYGVIAGSRTDRDAWMRVDWANDLRAWARRVVTTGDLDGQGGPGTTNDERLRRALIGNESLDTVLVSDVSRLALYDERELASALGAEQLDRRRSGRKNTGSLYAAVGDANSSARGIEIDYDGLFPGHPTFNQTPAGKSALRQSIDNWIDGDTNRNSNGTIGNGILFEEQDEPKALRFLVDPYTGELTEVVR